MHQGGAPSYHTDVGDVLPRMPQMRMLRLKGGGDRERERERDGDKESDNNDTHMPQLSVVEVWVCYFHRHDMKQKNPTK
jgi:hypothetical protein